MDQKKLGILLIVLALCICCFAGVQFFRDRDYHESRIEEQQKEKTGADEAVEEESPLPVEESEPEAEGEPEDAKEGVPDPEAYSQQVTVDITGMSEQVKALVKDPEAFEAAVKQYVYEHSLDHVEVTCKNIVTTYYSLGKQEFLMEIESEGLVFYVMQDLEDADYHVEEAN